MRCVLLVVALAVFGCAAEQRDAGHYRLVTVTDGLFGMRCQPRTDLYFVDRSRPGHAPVYLGTCGTPKFVTHHLGMPGDPSCFAIADDGTGLVFFHRPNWCGARPSAVGGITLLYTEQEHVGQVWAREPIAAGAIRVAWKNAAPSRGGAVCSQHLVIRADGSEAPMGVPATIHGCMAGRGAPEPD
jgi:hypothetical protein